MGCCSSTRGEGFFEQSKPINLSLIDNGNELKQAQILISLIIKIRNRIIYIYHKLIYLTGACLYIKPSISHCIKNIFYKISREFNGNFENCDIQYYEDPPYLKFNMSILSDDTKEKIKELFDFIKEIRGYKNILNQIDNDSPTLLYLKYENKYNISKKDIEKIHHAMDLFKQLLNMKQSIWNQYKREIYIFIKNNYEYLIHINDIGKEASEKNLSDIYEICMLNYGYENEKKLMYPNIKMAKNNWESIMKNDTDSSLDSINQNYN